MKRTSMRMKILLSFVSLIALALPGVVRAQDFIIGSGSSWHVVDATENPLGTAQNVCLNATSPSNCPADATLYDYSFNSWTANIPGAAWIWAPSIISSTTPAANAAFTFQTEFYLCETPSEDPTFALASDNLAEVFINGRSVLISTSAGMPRTATIPANLFNTLITPNALEIVASNGATPADCPAGNPSDRYQCNPAGIVFGTILKGTMGDPPLTCDGKPTGTIEPFCKAGESGRNRICVCGRWLPSGTCTPLPPMCAGKNGPVAVGTAEPIDCPAGTLGTASHTCQSNGWGPNDFSACAPACRGQDGTLVAVGTTEPVNCPAGTLGTASRTCHPGGIWSPDDISACQPEMTCTGTDGNTYRVNEREQLSCPAFHTVGEHFQTCQADGSWAVTNTCALPVGKVGDLCIDRGNTIATCEVGLTCASKPSATCSNRNDEVRVLACILMVPPPFWFVCIPPGSDCLASTQFVCQPE